jgi:thiol-disulfide isomerase/thioredoxin
MSFFSKLRTAGSLPVEGHLPGFDGATGWLNSPPQSAADLDGKVVLVDFWTYTCINWLRTLAYVRAWAERYQDQGLVVVGVHTPEFPFERDVDNVRQAVKDMTIAYPVAIDSDYAIWQAFANRFWPAIYIADAEGRIRHHQFGEGGYAECEMVIQRLLRDSGRDAVPHDLVSVDPTGLEAQADWAKPQISRNLPRLRASTRVRISRRCSHRPDPQLRRARPVESEPLGTRRGLDDRASGERARPHRRRNPLPLPRPRHPPRHGTASARCFRAVPRTHRW